MDGPFRSRLLRRLFERTADVPGISNDENFSNEDLEILHAIASARSAKPCNEAFALATRRFGNDAFACGEVDVTKRDRVVFFSMEWSEVWRKFYLRASCIAIDAACSTRPTSPSPGANGRTASASPRRNGTPSSCAASTAGSTVLSCRSGARVRTSRSSLSVVCTKLLDPAADKAFLRTHASFCYLERIRGVIAPSEFPVAPLGLTPRELECLGLVAQGYSAVASRRSSAFPSPPPTSTFSAPCSAWA